MPENNQPRGVRSTIIATVLLGPVGGLLWIGRIWLAVLAFVILAIPIFLAVSGLTMWPSFPAILSHATTWIVWIVILIVSLAVVWVLRPGSQPNPTFSAASSVVVLSLVAVLAPILVALFFTYKSYSIPSGSMMPTLLVGDHLFVDRSSYGYGPYSFPLAHLFFEDRQSTKAPERGDVVVFKLPSDTSIDYIMRIVGLPGETVQMQNGQVLINGMPLEQTPMLDHQNNSESAQPAKQFLESLPNGRSYAVLDLLEGSSTDDTRAFEIPEGHYFLLGDNRDSSADSRLHVGYVPFENLVGKAVYVYFNIQGSAVDGRQYP